MFFQLAFNNIWRNKRRTLLVGLSIVFGVVVIVFTGSLTNGISRLYVVSSIEEIVGAMQVEHKDYEKEHKFKPLETTLTGSPGIIKEVEAFPGVTSAFGVLQIFGFISNGSKGTTFFGRGVEVAAMKRTLPKMERTIIRGNPLGENPNGVLLGPKLAENLGLEIGDSVMLLVQTLKGGLNMVEVVFVGSQQETDELDYKSAHYVEMHLSTAQKLFRMPDRVSQIVIGHNDFEKIRPSARRLQQKLDQRPGAVLRVKDYTETIPGYEVHDFFDLIAFVVGFVLFLVVGTGIANTMFMSVMERKKEIGTMKAVGAENRHIKFLFLLEGFFISLFGVLSGLVVAVIVVAVTNAVGGVSLPPPPGSSTPMTIPTILNMKSVFTSIGLALVVGTLASYFPAAVSAKLDPVDTLRQE